MESESILSEIINPYRPGEPVADPAMLFGRQEAADWVERQIEGNARTLALGGLPLIGKSSFVRHAAGLQNLAAFNLLVELSPPPAVIREGVKKGEAAEPGAINTMLHGVLEQLTPQLQRLDLIREGRSVAPAQSASAMREFFSQANKRLGTKRLLLYFDDLHRLCTDDMALVASFLTALLPLLDECPRLHIIFTANQTELKQIEHPLIEAAPTFNLGPLATDASLSMVTLPVKDILRFDYGVTKRIVEINSHHPYYLTLFCHTLLNRQMQDGWVNQRDFDSALNELLDSPIEPFTQIWNDSSWVERAILAGMAAVQGAHGPMTDQEITRFLQRQHSEVDPLVVKESLNVLAGRGVLVPMGAVSYRFHVELLRHWLREHTNLARIIEEVDWPRLAAQARSRQVEQRAARPPAISPRTRARQRERSDAFTARPRRRLLWPILVAMLAALCLLSVGAVLAVPYLPLPFWGEPTEAPAVAATAEPGQATESTPQPATTATPAGPTPTPSPTPPVVVGRSLPSITYMGREVDQSWRIYVMNADGSNATALSPEGVEDTAPVWSPDGQWIAFVSQRDGNREIYVMDSAGQNPVNLTQHPSDDWTPAWSPDGNRLAFSSIRTGGWEIYLMDTACLDQPESCPNSLTQITANGTGNIIPAWSPDGGRIAYSGKVAGNWDIYTMAPDGSNPQPITTNPANDLAPIWSPDGTRLAFESNRDGNVEIYVIQADGSGQPRNITDLAWANDHGPTWSPDGQRLVFYSNREGNWDIFSTTLDGQTVVNLTNTPERDEQTPAWRP